MGAFIAKDDIQWGGVNAYTRGQTVEADAVEANGWQDFVVAASSKEAREIRAEITGRVPADFDTKAAAKSTSSDAKTEQKG